MVAILPVIGAGLAVANAVGRLFSGAKQTKEAKKINPIFNQYKSNPFAGQQLDFAKQAFADPSFGTRGDLTRNIFSNNANFMDNVSRNATDSSQALALGAAGLGQTNQNLVDANTGFMNNKAAMLQNLNRAYGVNIDEGDKEYESMLQKYQMDSQRKDALRNAGAANKYGSVSDMSSMAFQLGNIFKNSGRFTPLGSRDTTPAEKVSLVDPKLLPRTTPNFR
jgi:hypothetical protein